MTQMETQPPIHIFNIRIDEPVTTATDLLVSAVCFYAFFMLKKEKKNKVNTFIRYYFMSMGFATLFGGIFGHAFLYAVSFSWKLPGWITSMLSIALFERASIEHAKPLITRKTANVFKIVNIIELATFMVITMITLNFFFVEVHSAYGLMIVVLSLQSYVFIKTKNKGSKLIIIAVFITAIAAVVFMTKLSINKWFNHLDLSHIIMAIAAYIFYLGAKKLEIVPPNKDARV